MARKQPVRPAGQSNGTEDSADHDESLPPPSTLAAQLAQKQQRPDGTSAFCQLLDEIIQSPDSVGSDVEESYKLARVIAEAALKVPTNANPFADADSNHELLASLDVIEIAFQRSPEILFYAGTGTDGPGSQLCLLLLPRLLSLMVLPKQERLVVRCRDLLVSFCRRLCETPSRWSDYLLLLYLLQSCAEDLLLMLETKCVNGLVQDLVVTVPSPDSLGKIAYGGQPPITVKPGMRVQIPDVSSALSLLRQLLVICNTHSVLSIHSKAVRSKSVQILERMSRFLAQRVANRTTPAAVAELAPCLDASTVLLETEPDTSDRLLQYKIHRACCILSVEMLRNREWQNWSASFTLQAQLVLSRLTDSFPPARSIELDADLRSALEKRLELNGRNPVVQDPLSAEIDALRVLFSNNQGPLPLNADTHGNSEDETGSRPHKRQKLSHAARDIEASINNDTGRWQQTGPHLEELCRLLGGWNPNNLQELHSDVVALFADLSEIQQTRVLDILALLPCHINGASKIEPASDMQIIPLCRQCRSPCRKIDVAEFPQWHHLHNVITKLASSSAIQASKKLRVGLMLAAQIFIWHTPVQSHISVVEGSQAKLAEWCLHSLRSSARELRLAAAHTLPNFTRQRPDFDDAHGRMNRIRVLQHLRDLSQGQESRFSEAIISSLGNIGKESGDEELELVLLQLVGFLGHGNPLVCSLAQLELRRLADARGLSSDALFKPFWRTIAITAVKDLPTRPQKVQQLSDFLGLSLNQFLLMTRVETIPFLVLWKRQNAIQRIVQARGKDSSPWSLCVSPKTLNAILSLILVNHAENSEAAIQECLKQTSREFAQEDVASLLKTQPAAIAFEVLKQAGESVGERRDEALKGFAELTALVERKSPSATRTAATQVRLKSAFLENHALGIMNLVSTCTDDFSQPWLERRRALRGLEQLIVLGSEHLSFALPQICACLQSALDVPELRNDAFSAWMCLVDKLENDDDVEALVEKTFAIIVQGWEHFSAESQRKAYDGVGRLLKDRPSVIHEMLDVLPSFGDIPLMSKYENQLGKLRGKMDIGFRFGAFGRRCEEENPAMVLQALRELLPFLDSNQQWVHDSIASEQPDVAVPALVRSLLGICSRFNREHDEIASLTAKCLGVVGCVDSNKLEVTRPSHDLIVLHNFAQATECLDFVTFMLENVLVKAFNSAPNARAHSFLAWVMQELLTFSGFSGEATHFYRPQGSQGDEKHQKWMQISESARSTLTPFLTSRYSLSMENKTTEPKQYPIFSLKRTHGSWLRDFTHDLLQRGQGDNARQIFAALARVVRLQDLSVATFLLPFAVANITIGGLQADKADIVTELQSVLESPPANKLAAAEREIQKSCVESVFQVLDYLSRWLHEKRRRVATARSIAARSGKKLSEAETAMDEAQIQSVETLLATIPAETIANRSVEVHSLARALQHWEAYIRQKRGRVQPPVGAVSNEDQVLWSKLHDIYANIDEPDGLEGIYAHLNILGPSHYILDHQKAGRWAAAESWYEMNLAEDPNDLTLHENYLSCLNAAGKYQTALKHIKCLKVGDEPWITILDSASQAAWNTESWRDLESLIGRPHTDHLSNFNIGLGHVFLAMQKDDNEKVMSLVQDLRLHVARSLSGPATSSLQTCHSELLKLQALYEVESISAADRTNDKFRAPGSAQLRRRLEVLGSYITDKQYLLGIRRAVMNLNHEHYDEQTIAASWASTAKLARKSNNKDIAYNAANQAWVLGADSAVFEQAKFMWNEGEHRKAIAEIVGAIDAHTSKNARNKEVVMSGVGSGSTTNTRSTAAQDGKSPKNNLLLARAHLLHAKWLDLGGQTQSSVINAKYQQATRTHQQWEKGLYYLGKFYNKLLESEKALPTSKQSYQYLSGETAKLVIENYLRSLIFGCKYISETLPRLLTLWLEFGVEVSRPISKDVPDETRIRAMEARPKIMDTINKQVKKYGDRIPAYLFYTALNQMLTRIGHPNAKVYEVLAGIIVRVLSAHPQQGLWAILAVVKSSKADRVKRGVEILNKLKERSKSLRHENNSLDIKELILQGQKLADTLLHACNATVDQRTSQVSLTRDLGFSPRAAPCALVVPVERALTASLPTGGEDVVLKSHRAFPMSREAVTISSFSDDVLVLSSLQRPRKLVVRGSDGRKYGLLCKPKDDLRKDQRLMEFNAVINKSLKKDAESSKRRLYIRTYAVTPLNEECGLIEWVDGLKPIRDILLSLYRSRGIKVDYGLLRELLNDAAAPENPEGWRIFTETILPMYQPALHEWFVELFPSPDSWFNARLRYTRSCAVASMTGHVLGLGDRHGENVLLEESNGGVFHVDFNCLFDKGLTFEKPERVPFRLTHNMVDAFGAYGVDGPFRRSAECAMSVMRANQDALLTTLETFVYDPTADFVGGRKKPVKGVPETPKEVLESVQSKVRGLMRGDSVPLSVQGHVDALIQAATNPKNLSAMYIGWCAFL